MNAEVVNRLEKPDRWRFSLGGLLGFVTMVCVWLAVMGLRSYERELTVRCEKMPPNDHALIAWLQRNEATKDILVTRDADVLTIQVRKRQFVSSPGMLLIPMKTLGYGDVQTISYNWKSGWGFHFRPAFQWMLRNYWLVAITSSVAILAVIYVLSRKHRKSVKLDTGRENPQQVP
jgi:hypothetical protein